MREQSPDTTPVHLCCLWKGRMDPGPRIPGGLMKAKEKARKAEGSQASCLSQQNAQSLLLPSALLT